MAVFFRILLPAVLAVWCSFGQTTSPTPPASTVLAPDPDDPAVVRARTYLERVKDLVATGALPRMRLQKAEEDLQDALDTSLLRQTLYSTDLTVEQTDRMIAVAERMVYRRTRALDDVRALVASGVMSRAEADVSAADLDRAQKELQWARARAQLVAQLAESVRLQQNIANMELQVEQHPDWIVNGLVEKFPGTGSFTASDFQKVEIAFMEKFARPLPISANGDTALHRSMGFDHRGRVDVALNPDQPEGSWLRQYLTSHKLPYFAFRGAIAGKATGAHIHLGPQSTKFAAAPETAAGK